MPNRFKASSFTGVVSTIDNSIYHMPQEQFQVTYDHHQNFQPTPQHFVGPPTNFGPYRASEPHFVVQPRLSRASTLEQTHNLSGSRQNHFDPRVLNVKVTLSFRGEVGSMTTNWTEQERQSSRRLVLISWTQEYSHLTLSFRPIPHKDYIPGMPVLSCIYWEDTDKYYVTSVDLITLLEHLVHARFPVEEKNRIRRNLQSLKPLTITKGNERFHSFFQLIMQYDCPKPRHIEKDVKVLYWSSIEDALCKVLSKYTVDPYIAPPSSIPPQNHGPMQQNNMPQGPPPPFPQQTHHMPSIPNEQYAHESQFPPQHMPQFFSHVPDQSGQHPAHSLPPTHSFAGGYFPSHYNTFSTAGSAQYHQNSIVDPLTPAHGSNSVTPTVSMKTDGSSATGYSQMGYAYQPNDTGPSASEMP